MNSHTFHSHGPVRRETLLLGMWVESPFPGEGRQFVTREAEVLWVREEESRIELFWDADLLDGISRWTHVPSAIGEAREVAAKRRVTAADRLEVRVTCLVTETPATPGRQREEAWMKPEYVAIEHAYTGTPEELARVASFQWLHDTDYTREWNPGRVALEKRTVAEGVVWSSRRSEEENAAALAAFLAPFQDAEAVCAG
jgi:hypothetical protein